MLKVGENPLCSGCPLARIFPENNFVAPLICEGDRLAIAEAPGQVESELGTPLVGPSGSWLFGRIDEATGRVVGGLYKRAGVDGTKVSRINCINCRPPENVFPTDPDAKSYISREDAELAISHCYRNHVLPLLAGRSWSRIDLFGDKALRIVGGVEGGIMRWRGSPLPIPDLGPTPITIPTIHPAALARDQTLIPAVVSDLKKSLQVSPEFYTINPTLEQVQAFQATTFCGDIETNMSTGEITMVSLCDRPYRAIVVPPKGAYLAELKRIFRNCEYFIGQNSIAFDEPILREHGIVLNPNAYHFDTMLAHALVQPDLSHGLAFLGSLFCQKPAWKHLSGEDEATYSARDVDVTFQVWQQLKHAIVAAGVDHIYNDLSVPLAKICGLMHRTGFKVDPSRIGAVREELTKESLDAETRLPDHLRTHTIPIRRRIPAPPGTLGKSGKPVKFIFEAASETVTPWRSTVDVQKFLYSPTTEGGLALPVQLHIKSQRPTSDKIALDKLARTERKRSLSTQGDVSERHSRNARYLESIQKLRKLDELLTTFCKEEMLHVDRMYPHFNVHGTSSGRLSSSEPNLQNIPASARYIYVPTHSDWRLLECVHPTTRLLTSSLEWKPAGGFEAGDELIGFDETASRRKTRITRVTNTRRIVKHSYRLKTSAGDVVASLDHSFLVKRNRTNLRWMQVKDIQEGDEIAYLCRPWETDCSNEGGWIAGILDGEGWCGKNLNVGIGQNPGVVLDRFLSLVKERGYSTDLGKGETKCKHVRITDEAFAGLRMIGEFRPQRLLAKAQVYVEGKQVWGKRSARAKVLAKQYVNLQEVVALETDCHTYVAEGFLSHNCDYSSIENRLTAYFANDTERLKRWAIDPTFNEHRWTASMFFGIPYDEVERDNDKDAPYGKAKRIGHGSNYGMGPNKISKLYDMDLAETRRLCGLWREINALTCKWQDETGRLAKEQGFLQNPFGRKRWFYTDSYFTESLSFLPQSTGADIILRSMVALYYDRIGWPEEAARRLLPIVCCVPHPIRLLLQVHDSLVFELPGSLADDAISTVRTVMEQPVRELGGLSIPIDVKLADAGCSWGEVRKWQPLSIVLP